MIKSIMIVGVGGQGTLLASRILGDVLLANKHDVKVSEVHGMSQRGGSVVTYVRYGKQVASPIVDIGQADVILAFEQLEALRYLPYAKKDCLMIINTQKINPMPVIAGKAEYPRDIISELKQKQIKAITVDAKKIAQEVGNTKAVNIVLLGLLAKNWNISKRCYIDSITKLVPQKFLQLNIDAFNSGFDL